MKKQLNTEIPEEVVIKLKELKTRLGARSINQAIEQVIEHAHKEMEAKSLLEKKVVTKKQISFLVPAETIDQFQRLRTKLGGQYSANGAFAELIDIWYKVVQEGEAIDT